MNEFHVSVGDIWLLIFVLLIAWWTRPPKPKDEFLRGYEDGLKFLSDGIDPERIRNYCALMEHAGTFGRYEAGMMTALETLE